MAVDQHGDAELLTAASLTPVTTGPAAPSPEPPRQQVQRARLTLPGRGLAMGIGAVIACVALGSGLGVAITSASSLGVLNPDPIPPAAPVSGVAGLTPAGLSVDLALAGEFTTAPVSVVPDESLLPSSCPASSWQVGLVPPARPGAVTITVGLAASAPESCQGFAGDLPVLVTLADGVQQVTARSATPVAVGVLATPGLTLQQRAGHVVITPIHPASGPQPTAYAVETRRDGGAWSPICASTSGTECVAPRDTSGASAEFRVIASVGAWSRASAPVKAIDLTQRDR